MTVLDGTLFVPRTKGFAPAAQPAPTSPERGAAETTSPVPTAPVPAPADPSSETRSATGAQPADLAQVTPHVAAPAEEAALRPLASVASPRTAPSLERRRRLERRHSRRLLLTDAAVVAAASLLAITVGGLSPFAATPPAAGPSLASAAESFPDGAAGLPDLPVLTLIVALTAAAWWAALALTVSRGFIGSGRREFARVIFASINVFGLLGIVLALTDAQPLYAQLIVAAPVGLLGLLGARAMWRRRLLAERQAGASVSRALVVGRPADVACVTANLGRTDASGYRLAGTVEFDVVPSTGAAAAQIAGEATRLGADAIVVASAAASDADFIKRLGWCLEGTAAELIVANGLVDISRTRMSLHAVDGLPLVRVRMPAYEGGAHVAKRLFDIAVSALALTGIALILPLVALAIVIDSPGPVFFAQERVGRDGRTFRMLKFRSMKPTAEAELEALRTLNEGSGPLFKLHADPRVTRVGRFLRRYSLDELPQFWNVLIGDMSVVGPRPPLPNEVLAYDDSAFRRLYVKPGITGPWQVGGRSDLSWQESVRIDLGYVENWSLRDDLSIMWRTVMVMFRPEGAY